MKPTLKAPESKRLKQKDDELLSSFAFNFNLRRSSLVEMDEEFDKLALEIGMSSMW